MADRVILMDGGAIIAGHATADLFDAANSRERSPSCRRSLTIEPDAAPMTRKAFVNGAITQLAEASLR